MAATTVSMILLAQGNAQAAVKSAKEALAILAAIGDGVSVAAVYSTTCAEAYLGKGDTFRAAKSVSKAIPIYESMGNKVKVASCYTKMASIELEGKDYAKVEDYVTKAMAAAGEAGDTKAGGAALSVLIDAALAQDDYWKAL